MTSPHPKRPFWTVLGEFICAATLMIGVPYVLHLAAFVFGSE